MYVINLRIIRAKLILELMFDIGIVVDFIIFIFETDIEKKIYNFKDMVDLSTIDGIHFFIIYDFYTYKCITCEP